MLAVVCLCGCGKKTDVVSADPDTYEPNTVLPAEFGGYLAGKKLYLTSLGQSGDISRLALQLDGENIEYTRDNVLFASNVESGSVVFVVVGCSIKGMAESGLTPDTEIARAQKFFERSKNGEIQIVAWHIGGPTRRGYTSDTLIEYVFTRAQLDLFTANGNIINGDGNLDLSNWAREGSVPYCQITDFSPIPEILKILTGAASND